MYSPGAGFVVPPKEAMTTTPPLFSGRVLNCGGVGGGFGLRVLVRRVWCLLVRLRSLELERLSGLLMSVGV